MYKATKTHVQENVWGGVVQKLHHAICGHLFILDYPRPPCHGWGGGWRGTHTPPPPQKKKKKKKKRERERERKGGKRKLEGGVRVEKKSKLWD